MRFATTFAVLSALATAAVAQVQFTVLTFATVTAGQEFDLTWANATGPVTIVLNNGPSGDLKPVTTIASGLSGSSYSWQVPSSLVNLETYALSITDGTTTNYSTQFQLIGGVSASTTGSASGSTTTGTASSTGSVTSSASVTTATDSTTSTVVESTSGTLTTRTTSGTVTRTTSTSAPSATTTPPSGAAAGLSSNVALVLLAAGALFMIN